MATYPIRIFGDPVLKQRAREVEEIDDAVVSLVDSMYETMYDAAGVGLAAPQVGVQRRVFTYDVGDGPGAIINPEIVESSGEWVHEEGCLSVPGLHFEVVRPKLVTLRGLDADGSEVVLEADELMARMLQHEVDHLDGKLFLDRLDPEDRKHALRAIREHDLTTAPRNTVPAL